MFEKKNWSYEILHTICSDSIVGSSRVQQKKWNKNEINEIKKQAGKDILLFGSPTATHSLIQLNLIDGYWLFVNPIILGRGIPLFVDIKDKIELKLLTTRQFTSGVTELNYTVDRQ